LQLCSLMSQCFVPLRSCLICFLMLRRPLSSSLFPYTTLFRSVCVSGSLSKTHGLSGSELTYSVKSRAGTVILPGWLTTGCIAIRSEEHTSELQSRGHLVCRLLLEKKKNKTISNIDNDKLLKLF